MSYGGVPVEPKGQGYRVVVEFRQRISLGAGDYFLTAGVADLNDEDVVPVDRRYDLAYLHVMAVDKSFGVANLYSEVEVNAASITEGAL